MKKTKKEIFIFLISLVIFSGLSYLLIFISNVSNPEDSWAAFLLVYSPFLAAIITKLISERNIKKLGWKFGNGKYLLISLLIPIGYGIIVYGFAWLTKIGEVKEHIQISIYFKPLTNR